MYVPGQTLTVSFGPDALTASWIDVKVACGQSPSSGLSSTQYVVPCGGSEYDIAPAPTAASPVPAIVVSWSPIVTSAVGKKVDATTLTGSTIESESLCHAEARATPSSRLNAAVASTANSSFLFIFSPLGGWAGRRSHSMNRAPAKPD